METKRIVNEDSWIEDKYWICPYCSHKNENSTWMADEPCKECNKVQIFETDYVDANEGTISSTYIGPQK